MAITWYCFHHFLSDRVWRIIIVEIIFRDILTLVLPSTPGCLFRFQSWNKYFWKCNNWHWNGREKRFWVWVRHHIRCACGQSALPLPSVNSEMEADTWKENKVPRFNSKWLSKENNSFIVCKTETTVDANTRLQSVMISVHSPNK